MHACINFILPISLLLSTLIITMAPVMLLDGERATFSGSGSHSQMTRSLAAGIPVTIADVVCFSTGSVRLRSVYRMSASGTAFDMCHGPGVGVAVCIRYEVYCIMYARMVYRICLYTYIMHPHVYAYTKYLCVYLYCN